MVIVLILLIYFIYLYGLKAAYDQSDYEKVSGLSFKEVYLTLNGSERKGAIGEYKIYKALKQVEGYKQILANVYVTKEDGSTTEIDLLMIHEKGIVVVESKNYSGWIFGRDHDYQWTQVLNKHTKNRFYNPILQNANHIKHLSQHLTTHYKHGYYSLIVFGKSSKLKKIKNTLRNVGVIYNHQVRHHLNTKFEHDFILMTEEEVDLISEKLQVFCHQDASVKEAHVEAIRRNIGLEETKQNKLKLPKLLLRSFYRLKKKDRGRLVGIILILIILMISGLSSELNQAPTKSNASETQSYYEDVNTTIIEDTNRSNSEKNTVTHQEENVPLENIDMKKTQVIVNETKKDEDALEEIPESERVTSEVEVSNTEVYLSLGINYEAVVSLYGEPDAIEADGRLKYGSSFIYLKDNLVIGWKSNFNQLSAGFQSPSGTNFFLDASKSDVLSALGTPSEINPLDLNAWRYESSTVNFENERVVGYYNLYDQLSHGLDGIQSEGFLSLEMTSAQVLDILGAPSKIQYIQPYEWYYENSKVWFNKEWEVIGWENLYGQLDHVRMQPSSGEKIRLDLSQDQILNILGSPTTISYINPKEWKYENSSIWFDDVGYVSGWQNLYDQLNFAMYQPNSKEYFQLGLNQEQVISILGSPTKISYLQPYEWYYQNSKVWFDKSFHVIGYENLYKQLDAVLKVGIGGVFSLDSSKNDVLNVLGSPSKILWTDQEKWYYNNASIVFKNNLVESVFDPLNQLEGYNK